MIKLERARRPQADVEISLNDFQANILLRLLAKQEVNLAEWRELLGLSEQIKEAVRVSDTLKTSDINA